MKIKILSLPKHSFVDGGDTGNGVTTFSGLKHGQFGLNGIPQGIASDGLPNYVEGGGFDKNGNPLKGEIKYKDYIYSARNKVSKSLLNKYNLHEKYADKPFAEVAEQLQKESENRPNDPISKRTLDDMMSRLANAQEEYNYKKEMRRLSKDLSNLQQQQNQFALMQSPQQTQIDPYAQQEMPVDAFNMPSDTQYANGGHIYQDGTPYTSYEQALLKNLGLYTMSDLENLLGDEMSITDIDWNNLTGNEVLMNAIRSNNPALADAIERGYNFGFYTPQQSNGTIDTNQRGNWFANTGSGWNGSNDAAFIQATRDMTQSDINKLSRKKLAELMRNTDAYKKTTNWLQNEDNALKYLSAIVEDKSQPKKAKDWAYQFIKKHRDGTYSFKKNYNYNTMIKPKREDLFPGSYWYSHPEALKGKLVTNYFINDDGTVEEALNVNPKWTNAGKYNWEDDNYYQTANYYRAPTAKDIQSSDDSYQPFQLGNINDNITRKAGLIGSGLSSALAFATPPDMTYANYLNSLAGQYNYIAPTLLGRERENDLDVNLSNNQMLAQNAANQRSIRDNNNRWNQTAASLAQQQQMFNNNALFNVGAQQAQQADDLAVHKLNYDLSSKDQDTIRAYDLANLDTNTRRINMLQNSAQAADNATTLASTNRSQSLTNFLNNLSALGKENIQFGLVNKAIEDKAIQGFPYLYSNWLGNTYSV